jgi:hypothetical protein
MIDPNSFVNVPKLFEFLEIPDSSHERALGLLRVRMADIITCLPRALNGWTGATLVDTENGPTAYAAISTMSPDRRQFYLQDKKRLERMVYGLPISTVTSLTVDPSYPLDICCHHWNSPYPMYVFYSSKIVDPVKRQKSDVPAEIDRLAVLAMNAITTSGARVLEDIVSKLPRARFLRHNTNYQWLPISANGLPMFGPPNYPNKGIVPQGAILTIDWYRWFNIVSQDPSTRVARFSVSRFGEHEEYFVYKNTYHLVIQKLKVDFTSTT